MEQESFNCLEHKKEKSNSTIFLKKNTDDCLILGSDIEAQNEWELIQNGTSNLVASEY